MNKSKILLRIAGVSAVFATTIIFGLGTKRPVVQVHADDDATTGCTLATISGNYGFLGNGVEAAGPFNDVGIFESDGAGKYVLDFTQNFDGVVGAYTASGTYDLKSNCTGTLTFAVDGGKPYPFAVVVVTNGSEINAISKVPHVLYTWDLKKIN
jgi:hypothetical protein